MLKYTEFHLFIVAGEVTSCLMDTFEMDPVTPWKFCKLVCRNIRIGSYRTVPSGGVIFSSIGIRIPVPSVATGKKICFQQLKCINSLFEFLKFDY